MSYVFPFITIALVCALFGYIAHRLIVINERLQKFLMVRDDRVSYDVANETVISTIPQKNGVRYNRYVGAFMSGEIDDATIKELGGEQEPVIQ